MADLIRILRFQGNWFYWFNDKESQILATKVISKIHALCSSFLDEGNINDDSVEQQSFLYNMLSNMYMIYLQQLLSGNVWNWHLYRYLKIEITIKHNYLKNKVSILVFMLSLLVRMLSINWFWCLNWTLHLSFSLSFLDMACKDWPVFAPSWTCTFSGCHECCILSRWKSAAEHIVWQHSKVVSNLCLLFRIFISPTLSRQ